MAGEEHIEPPVRSLSDGDVALWVEQGAIHVRAFDPGRRAPDGQLGPHRDPVELTEDEARQLASMLLGLADQASASSGLDPVDGEPRIWNDPVTGKQALRLDRGHRDRFTGEPYDNPNAAVDHTHGFNDGRRVRDSDGESHFPIKGETPADPSVGGSS